MSPTWDEGELVFDRVRAFSAEVEQRLAACRALPPEAIYEQLYAMEGDELPPLPMETDALLRYTLLKAHEGLLFYVRKWLVNADGDMTAERAIDEMCADRQLDLLFREPPLAGDPALPAPNDGRQGELHEMRKGASHVERSAGRRTHVCGMAGSCVLSLRNDAAPKRRSLTVVRNADLVVQVSPQRRYCRQASG